MGGYFARLVKIRHASMDDLAFLSVNSRFHLRLSSKYVFKKKKWWDGLLFFNASGRVSMIHFFEVHGNKYAVHEFI